MSTAESQRPFEIPQRIVVMGVSGCGKSTIGAALAESLAAIYLDGDDLHSAENIRKMHAGIPLDDADRWPWLETIGDTLRNATPPVILGCSALKRRYRDVIRDRARAPVLFVYLRGSRAVIEARLAVRTGHFMPPMLLTSQFEALEEPESDEWSVTVNLDQSAVDIVLQIAAHMMSSFDHAVRRDMSP